jgi:hypothetical protein
MTRRVWLTSIAGFVASFVGVAALAFWLDRPAPGVTWENIIRISEGMTEEQVEALLGGPGTVYAEPHVPAEFLARLWQNPAGFRAGYVLVYFERGAGTVSSTHYQSRHIPPPTDPLTRLRRTLAHLIPALGD